MLNSQMATSRHLGNPTPTYLIKMSIDQHERQPHVDDEHLMVDNYLLRMFPLSSALVVGALAVLRPRLLQESFAVAAYGLDLDQKTLFVAFVAVLISSCLFIVILYIVRARRRSVALSLQLLDRQRRERDALMEVFHAANGSGWKDKTRWGSNDPVSGWKGVIVDRAGLVTKLILPSNELSGMLSEAIGTLLQLNEIDLRDNSLCGPLPESLGSLSNLSGLYLHTNNFSGPIPPLIADLPHLMGVYLFNNNFQGTY